MPDKPPQPPPNVLIPELLAPDHTNVFFRELVSRESDRFQQLNPIKRGTLYQDGLGADSRVIKAYPNLYFCRETVPSGSNTVAGMAQSDWVIWEWATGNDSESTYNPEVSYLADATTNPVFARTYTVRRDDYEASPAIATGSPLTALVGVQITNGGMGYKHAEAEFDCYGDDAQVEFVISEGVIISAIVTAEGVNFNDGSVINIVGDGSGATCIPLVQPLGAILTSQKKVEFPDGEPMGHEFVKVLRVYEVLPGPWVPFTRYDPNLGPIQGRRRAVLNTGQIGGFPTSFHYLNYEGRDGSSVVSIEIEERFSNGTGIPGPDGFPNPEYPVLEWSTYEQEKGTVDHTSKLLSSVLTPPPFEATLVRIGGGFIRKTWYEPYQDNPANLVRILTDTWLEVVINDSKLISEFGGGVVDVTERTGEPGTQFPERGLMVVSSETVTKSPDEQTLRNVINPKVAWPILNGHHTDETTGIVVNFSKQVIAANTPYPGTNRSGNCNNAPGCCATNQIQGPFIEDQPYDEDKMIRIISAVDLNTLPDIQCWAITHPVNFPPQLLSVEVIWQDMNSETATDREGDDPQAFAEVSSGSNGDVFVTSSSGFRGYAKGTHTRQYFFGPPNAGLVPVPFAIIPSSGTIVLIATNSSTNSSKNDNGGSSNHSEFHVQARAIDVRDHLVGTFVVRQQAIDSKGNLGPNVQVLGNPVVHTSPNAGALASTSGGSTVAIEAFGTRSWLDVRIPQSNPPNLTSGSSIIMEVALVEHPFNIWQLDIISVVVP